MIELLKFLVNVFMYTQKFFITFALVLERWCPVMPFRLPCLRLYTLHQYR